MQMHVKVDDSQVREDLERLYQKCKTTPKAMKIWTVAVRNHAQRNARAQGGRFWASIASATQSVFLSPFSAKIECFHVAGAHKQFGGSIRPKNRQFLTIPIAEDAKRKTVSDFTGVFRAGMVLAQNRGGVLYPLFALSRGVTQRAFPWWPSPKEVIDHGDQAFGYLKNLKK